MNYFAILLSMVVVILARSTLIAECFTARLDAAIVSSVGVEKYSPGDEIHFEYVPLQASDWPSSPSFSLWQVRFDGVLISESLTTSTLTVQVPEFDFPDTIRINGQVVGPTIGDCTEWRGVNGEWIGTREGYVPPTPTPNPTPSPTPTPIPVPTCTPRPPGFCSIEYPPYGQDEVPLEFEVVLKEHFSDIYIQALDPAIPEPTWTHLDNNRLRISNLYPDQLYLFEYYCPGECNFAWVLSMFITSPGYDRWMITGNPFRNNGASQLHTEIDLVD